MSDIVEFFTVQIAISKHKKVNEKENKFGECRNNDRKKKQDIQNYQILRNYKKLVIATLYFLLIPFPKSHSNFAYGFHLKKNWNSLCFHQRYDWCTWY